MQALMMNFIMLISLEKSTVSFDEPVAYNPPYMRHIQMGLGLVQVPSLT